MSIRLILQKFTIITAFFLCVPIFTAQISASSTMEVTEFSNVVVIREDYILSCREVFAFQYTLTAPPTEITFTWPYNIEDVIFTDVRLKEDVTVGRGDPVNYVLTVTSLNHSSGRETGFNMTLSTPLLSQGSVYRLEMRYLIKNQVEKTERQNFYDKVLGREKNNLKVEYWTHTWPLGSLSGENTQRRDLGVATQKQMRPKICEYADSGENVNWDIKAEYFAVTGHIAYFNSKAMTNSYLETHDSFGVSIYYGRTEKTWLFYGYVSIAVFILIIVMFKVLSRAKKKTERSGFFEDEEVEV